MDQEYLDALEAIKREGDIQIDLNHKIGVNHQFLVEEAIGNIAALKVLNNRTEEQLGNLP